MKELDALSEKCGYTGYMDKYVTYPPKGLLPLPDSDPDECDVWDMVLDAALTTNPAFNIYRIFDTVRVSLFLLCLCASLTS